MLLLLLLLLVSLPLHSMDVKTRLKRERYETPARVPQQAVADPTFLRAVYSGHMGLIMRQLPTVDLDAKGANTQQVEFVLRDESALSLAVETGNVALASVLLGKGASVHQVYKNGHTVLHKAVRHALNISRYVDSWQEVLSDRLYLVDLLIAFKADYSIRDSDGYTVFHVCAQKYADNDPQQRAIAQTVFNALLVSIWLAQHSVSLPQEVSEETKSILELPIFDNKTLADLACHKKCKSNLPHAYDCSAVALCDVPLLISNAQKEAEEIKKAASLKIGF